MEQANKFKQDTCMTDAEQLRGSRQTRALRVASKSVVAALERAAFGAVCGIPPGRLRRRTAPW